MRPPDIRSILAGLRDARRWRRWALEAVVLAAIVVAVTLWQNHGLAEGAAPPLAGMRNDGRLASLAASVGGGRATLVVFWADWCPVCRAEAGNIEAVAADWPVVSVATGSGGADAVTRHLRENGLAVPAIVDADGALARPWRIRGVPAHFVVDAGGNIRFRVVGYATEAGLRARLWWAQRVPS